MKAFYAQLAHRSDVEYWIATLPGYPQQNIRTLQQKLWSLYINKLSLGCSGFRQVDVVVTRRK